VVFAKYLASLSLVVLMLMLSAAYAITLGILGRPDWGPIYSGYSVCSCSVLPWLPSD
jgi:ABC-2 type transport system permease protein